MKSLSQSSQMARRFSLSFITVCGLSGAFSLEIEAAPPTSYNVVWTTPSRDASGVMPLGNGDLAAGVYAIENGDLYLLLAKNDAYTYMGDLFKTGRVRISLTPNPFLSGKPFRQTLDLATGSISIEADTVKIRIWADANRPLYHVEVTAPAAITITAQPDLWKRIDHAMYNHTTKLAATSDRSITQNVRVDRKDRIIWYFPVGDRSIFPLDLHDYQVEHMAATYADPFRFNTFGNLLELFADGRIQPRNDTVLMGAGRRFDIRIHALTMQTPKPESWVEGIETLAAQPVDTTRDWTRHCTWWNDFWNRGWIVASDNSLPPEIREKLSGEPDPSGQRKDADGAALVAQSYNVFRYIMACQSRGRVQAKFNGGLFTQQLRITPDCKYPRVNTTKQPDGSLLTHEDDRKWGRRFTFQNQRLLYWPLLASGDFDLMKPFFSYYRGMLDMRTAICKAWFGHDGAYYRENLEPTGAERESCQESNFRPPKTKPGEPYTGWFHDYYFTSGLEISAMMLDYAEYTGDQTFREQVLVPFARQILLFFDQHYPRGTDGKLRLAPAQVLETWWISVNPSPDIAGLRFCLGRLLAIQAGTTEDQARWRSFLTQIPDVPTRLINGQTVIAPAEKWEQKCNGENGELYPVFPFRCFGIGLGSAAIVTRTMQHRTGHDVFDCGCWAQDQIHWAYAGNASEAAKGLVRRFRIASPMCRFPMYGKEWPDSCPDFDHFGSGSTALQRMLVQEANGKILLLPAWPKKWDVDFKLHLTGRAVITGTVKQGALVTWSINPADRCRDVVVSDSWKTSPAADGNANEVRKGP